MNTNLNETSAALFRRLLRVAVMTMVCVAALGLTAAAGARSSIPPGGGGGGGGDGDPPLPPPKPNLVIGGSVTPYGASEWELRYTVSNQGNASTSTFHVAVQQSGSILLKDTTYLGLAAGASRSETIHIPRNNGCYLAVRFFADSTQRVSETNEYDNMKWAVGLLSPTCPTQPQYTVKAVSFHANDETGIDWLGSDEPYWIFSSVGMNGTSTSTVSHVFGDIDTGDTAAFSATEGCLYLSCSGGPAPFGMGFSIQLWEEDLGWAPQNLKDTANAFRTIGGFIDQYSSGNWVSKALVGVGDALDWIASWTGDDLIGSQTYAYDPTYLANRTPTAGSSFTDTRTYSGGGGEYTMTVLVTRVA